MAKARKEADFQALLRKLNVATNSLSEDEDVFAVTMAVLGAGPDQDQARRFRDELAFLRRLGPQWDADELVARMRRTFAPQLGSGRGYLGVTTPTAWPSMTPSRSSFARSVNKRLPNTSGTETGFGRHLSALQIGFMVDYA